MARQASLTWGQRDRMPRLSAGDGPFPARARRRDWVDQDPGAARGPARLPPCAITSNQPGRRPWCRTTVPWKAGPPCGVAPPWKAGRREGWAAVRGCAAVGAAPPTPSVRRGLQTARPPRAEPLCAEPTRPKSAMNTRRPPGRALGRQRIADRAFARSRIARPRIGPPRLCAVRAAARVGRQSRPRARPPIAPPREWARSTARRRWPGAFRA